MKIQLIVSTMYQTDYNLINKMNIQSDAVVINQCKKDRVERFIHDGHCITWVDTTTRGVGKSRNLGVLNSSEDADILLFSDEDVVYSKDAMVRVIDFFKHNEKAEMVVFNLKSLNPQRPEKIIKKNTKLHLWNCLKYGACRIAIKRKSLLANNVFFSLLFGGGAKYQAGEDNIFITNCIKKSMRCMASPVFLGTVEQAESTWFKGHDKRYYFDRGALFAAMYGLKSIVYVLLIELKHIREKKEINLCKRIYLQLAGIRKFRYDSKCFRKGVLE